MSKTYTLPVIGIENYFANTRNLLADGANCTRITSSTDNYVGHGSNYRAVRMEFDHAQIDHLRSVSIVSITLQIVVTASYVSSLPTYIGKCITDSNTHAWVETTTSINIPSGLTTQNLDLTSVGIPSSSHCYAIGGCRSSQTSEYYKKISNTIKLVVVTNEDEPTPPPPSEGPISEIKYGFYTSSIKSERTGRYSYSWGSEQVSFTFHLSSSILNPPSGLPKTISRTITVPRKSVSSSGTLSLSPASYNGIIYQSSGHIGCYEEENKASVKDGSTGTLNYTYTPDDIIEGVYPYKCLTPYTRTGRASKYNDTMDLVSEWPFFNIDWKPGVTRSEIAAGIVLTLKLSAEAADTIYVRRLTSSPDQSAVPSWSTAAQVTKDVSAGTSTLNVDITNLMLNIFDNNYPPRIIIYSKSAGQSLTNISFNMANNDVSIGGIYSRNFKKYSEPLEGLYVYTSGFKGIRYMYIYVGSEFKRVIDMYIYNGTEFKHCIGFGGTRDG